MATNFVKQGNQILTSPLNAVFTNCIIWGDEGFVDNEVVTDKQGTDALNLTFNNVLYRAKADPANTTLSNSIKNQLPQFDSIDVSRRFYNFQLKAGSPAINKGIVTPLLQISTEGPG